MYTWQELIALYRLTLGTSKLQPRYNIGPTATIDTVGEDDAQGLATAKTVIIRWPVSRWTRAIKK
jgi:putative SOS response-associated peptidase YedK